MKDLGKKKAELYPSMDSKAEKNKVVYPTIDLPLSVVDGMGLKNDDEVIVTIKGRVCGMEDTKWAQRISFEAKEGEVKKSGKKGESIIEEA